MMDFILQQLRKPYGILIPWLALVLLLAGVLWAVRTVGIDGAEQSRAKLELNGIKPVKNSHTIRRLRKRGRILRRFGRSCRLNGILLPWRWALLRRRSVIV